MTGMVCNKAGKQKVSMGSTVQTVNTVESAIIVIFPKAVLTSEKKFICLN